MLGARLVCFCRMLNEYQSQASTAYHGMKGACYNARHTDVNSGSRTRTARDGYILSQCQSIALNIAVCVEKLFCCMFSEHWTGISICTQHARSLLRCVTRKPACEELGTNAYLADHSPASSRGAGWAPRRAMAIRINPKIPIPGFQRDDIPLAGARGQSPPDGALPRQESPWDPRA